MTKTIPVNQQAAADSAASLIDNFLQVSNRPLGFAIEVLIEAAEAKQMADEIANVRDVLSGLLYVYGIEYLNAGIEDFRWHLRSNTRLSHRVSESAQ